MSSVLLRRACSTLKAQNGSLAVLRTASRAFNKPSYDKPPLLEAENVEYRPNDKRFLPGQKPADEPYPSYTQEERKELTRLKLEMEMGGKAITSVDQNTAPFNEVLVGQDDHGRFTKTEVIPDNDLRWFWVDRLMPINVLDKPIREGSVLIAPLPASPPDLPYFVARTRSRVYPLYRAYKVIGRDEDTYWRNRWDGLFNKYTATDVLANFDSIKWENNEKTIVLTMVGKVQGDIWQFEADARAYLEAKNPGADHMLSAVNEVRGTVEFKGDHIKHLHDFLKSSGF